MVSDDEEIGDERADPNCPIIRVSKEEKERLRRPWRRTLIIKLLGRKVGYSFLMNRLQRMWKPEASFDLITLDQDFFLAKFESLRDYEFTKYDGPWIILGHYLTVQEWVPNFIPWKNKLIKLLVWMRFPSLPIEYFEEDFMMKIGKEVDRPVKVDYTTSLVSKGKFARICVELDMSKPLLSKFTLAEEVRPIEYEGIHMVCFKCGIYGHKLGQCGNEENREANVVEEQPPSDGQSGDQQATKTQPATQRTTTPARNYKENFGAWMLVTRKDRKGQRRPDNQSQGQPDRGRNQNPARKTNSTAMETGSQYAALEHLTDTEMVPSHDGNMPTPTARNLITSHSHHPTYSNTGDPWVNSSTSPGESSPTQRPWCI
ncbi:uncharacterized protein LOC116022464 [Ipomoea triloba]|uniref:uncharacterized protein LOC116022464 n=1 Tax=Ipomoea triloba TaxID=35885 RepID=UPI00125DE5A1|nr:uncharacterized protein LOC116022464 [Ipomoea triloba]